jgi:hypothetical protein
MPSENKTITDLDSLSATTISDNDLFLFVDLKSNEIKNIAASEFAQYNVTASGILTTLVSGSFTGSFTGSLTGLIQSSSYASSSSLSLTSSYLFYNGLNNGTASYSISSSTADYAISASYSLSSSYATTASYSYTASYAYATGSTHSILTSDLSDYALNGLLSNTSSYIKYNGQNNGTVYRSIITETANYCLTASNLQDDNTTTVARSITSSFAQNALTSSFIVSASISNFAETSSLGSNVIFSYVRFRIQSAGTDGKYEIIPESWHNISNIGMSPNPVTGPDTYDIQFDVKYKDYAKPSDSNKNACITKFKPTVISNFEFGNLSELQKSKQSGANPGGGYTPYYFSSNGYSCTDSGFVLKFTLVGFDFDDSDGKRDGLPDRFYPRNFAKRADPDFSARMTSIANDLLEGSVFTAMVYIDPNGIDVNTPTLDSEKPSFVDHTEPC